MTEYIQVVTTVEQKSDAENIANTLLGKRLAACAQILGPVTSMYWWQGRIEQAGEYQCLLKSRQDLFDELRKAVLEVHPYEVPEILAFPVLDGSESYLRWLDEELR